MHRSFIKSLCATTALFGVMASAFAANQSVSFNANDTASFIGSGPVLQGGSDVITFDGIAPGTYAFELTLSGSFIHLSALDIDGMPGVVESNGRFLFADVVGTGTSPLTLTLVGDALDAQANYSGQLAVSAVDEPHDGALLLAGLMMGGLAIARKRR